MSKSSQSSHSIEAELVQAIRGYSGYGEKKVRKKTDKRLREHLTSGIKQVDGGLKKFIARLTKVGQLNEVELIEKLGARLETLIHGLEIPVYDNARFFELPEIDTHTLNQLYAYDQALSKQVQILVEEVTELERVDLDGEVLNEISNHLLDLIDGLNQTLLEREFTLMGGWGE